MAPASTERPKKNIATAVESSASRTTSSSLAGDASPSDPAVLRTLYTALLRTRMLEEQVLSLLRAGRVPSAAVPLLGGEATEIGACIGLQPDDSFSSTLPKLASHVVRETPLELLFAEIFGATNASPSTQPETSSNSFRVAPQTVSIIGQLNIAAGIALAYRQLQKTNVVVVHADDGLAALGFWHEAAGLASRYRLPIVFMVENCAQSHPNGSSVVHSDEDLRDRAQAYGFPGITVDGNDPVAVWRVTQESIHRARTGAGPTLIECVTWRWHAETGERSLYRHKARPSNNAPSSHDPLHQMEHYMRKRSIWQPNWKDALADGYRVAIASAIESAQKSAT